MSRWGKQEEVRPMTDDEARLHQLEFNAEVARLLKIRQSNPYDKRLWHTGKARVLSSQDLRYHDWLRAREEMGLPKDLTSRPSTPAHWSDDL